MVRQRNSGPPRTNRKPKWGLPIHVLRILLAERRMQPTPLAYVVATAAGLGLGLVLGAAVGWPWWAVTTGFVFLVWLLFLLSAFWGAGSDVGQSLLRVVNPRRADEVQMQRLRDGVASGLLIGYEVENWEGEKSIERLGWLTHSDFIDDSSRCGRRRRKGGRGHNPYHR